LSEERNTAAAKAVSSRGQAERGGKDCWNAEQLDPHARSLWRTSIASQSLVPREPIMGPLRTGKGRRRSRRGSLARLFHLHLHPLAATELDGSLPIVPATPILPEHGSRSNAEGMQQQTHPARLLRGRPVPLALLAQVTATTISDLGGEEHAPRAISFAALFSWMQALASRAAPRAISLRSKVAPGETPGFPGQASLRRSIAKGRSLVLSRLGTGGSKFGGANRRRLQLMPQLKTEVPDPLRDDLPCLLTTRRVRTPAV